MRGIDHEELKNIRLVLNGQLQRLDCARDNAQAFFDERSDVWRESAVADEFYERLGILKCARNALESAINELENIEE